MEWKKALGYIRVVTDDRNAIDEQKRDIENAVIKYGYRLEEIYTDTGSGAGLDRKGIKGLLDTAGRNRIDTVFVSDAHILSTDGGNTSELVERLSNQGVHVFSTREGKEITG